MIRKVREEFPPLAIVPALAKALARACALNASDRGCACPTSPTGPASTGQRSRNSGRARRRIHGKYAPRRGPRPQQATVVVADRRAGWRVLGLVASECSDVFDEQITTAYLPDIVRTNHFASTPCRTHGGEDRLDDMRSGNRDANEYCRRSCVFGIPSCYAKNSESSAWGICLSRP